MQVDYLMMREDVMSNRRTLQSQCESTHLPMLPGHQIGDEPPVTLPRRTGRSRDEHLAVFKIGGSLLDLPDLTERVTQVIGQRPDARPLLVVGGGTAADVVRSWDAQHRLGDDTAHELALLAMGLNEQFLERMLPRSRLVRSDRQFDMATGEGLLPILCAHCFLKWGVSAGHSPLPHSWDVTSDSIAAWAARVLQADELVLMKSVCCPTGMSAAEAASAGLVDACFTGVAAEIPAVGWCEAREAIPTIAPWLKGGHPTL